VRNSAKGSWIAEIRVPGDIHAVVVERIDVGAGKVYIRDPGPRVEGGEVGARYVNTIGYFLTKWTGRALVER
jgi:hypothetical protein